jgi:hypothetical protein
MVRNAVICRSAVHHIFLGEKVKEYEVGGVYHRDGGDAKCVQNLC